MLRNHLDFEGDPDLGGDIDTECHPDIKGHLDLDGDHDLEAVPDLAGDPDPDGDRNPEGVPDLAGDSDLEIDPDFAGDPDLEVGLGIEGNLGRERDPCVVNYGGHGRQFCQPMAPPKRKRWAPFSGLRRGPRVRKSLQRLFIFNTRAENGAQKTPTIFLHPPREI